jgi:hypothetical protein
MEKKMKILLVFLLLFVNACTHSVHMVNFTDFKPYSSSNKSAKLVKAKTEQFVVLWYADNTNYVNEAYKKLQDQCPRGVVTGIATQFYTSHGFFSWTNHLVMQGQCLPN